MVRSWRPGFLALVTVLLVAVAASEGSAQVKPRDMHYRRLIPCVFTVSQCGMSVSLGSGPYRGVANQSASCGGSACRTARIWGHDYSDFIPVGSSSRPQVIVTRTAPPSGAAGGSGGEAVTGGSPEEAAAPPPPPPTAAEAIATCPEPPRSEIHRNPIHRGLTGLDTWLWSGPIDPLVSRTEIRGYPVSCVATPHRWEWHTGDGGFYAVTTAGGPHPDNPVTHLYETKNPLYVLQLDVRWQLVTNYGSARVTATAMEPYTVIEVRSVLVEPGVEPDDSDERGKPPPDRRW